LKILFIFHESKNTGAIIALYNNILWLKKNGIDVSVLITQKGNFENDIRMLGKSFNWNEERKILININILARINRKIKRTISKPKTYKEILFEQLKKENFDLIYANTIASSIVIKELFLLNKPIIWHIHELELAINSVGRHHLEVNDCVQGIIANSYATKRNLTQNHNFDSDKIMVHYPTVNISDLLSKKETELNIKRLLSIPEDSFIVGTSGTAFSRKGCETFLILIKIIEELYPTNNFHFIWVGHNLNKIEIDHDIEHSGLKDRVTFTGNLENPFPYYQSFDVFISLSKEESFGLAAVEAALMEKPILFFDKTEGLSEIFSDKTGGEIPYLNLIVMANKLIELYEKPDLRKKLGKEAQNIAKNFDENLIMPDLLKTLIKIASNYKP
jgi:glycosyltransferase involved in cell wall biosynthesis